MDMQGVQPAAPVLPAGTPPIPPAQAAGNREIIQAVRAVQESGAMGEENELTFQLDRRTQRVVLRIVNRKTREVVRQVPPEYVLRMAEELRDPNR